MELPIENKDAYLVYLGGLVVVSVASVHLYRARSQRLRKIDDANNPFLKDCRRPPPTGKIEPKDKKSSVKNPLKSKLASKGTGSDIEKHYDVICIGSGAGSLTAASILAKTGRRVLILEQHSKLGGSCHTFKEGRFEFDTGLHYIGGMHPRNDTFRVLEQLSEGQLQWTPLDPVYDEVVIGKDPESFRRFNIFANFNNWKNALYQYFPNEKAAIDEVAHLFHQSRIVGGVFGALKFVPIWITKIIAHTRFMKPMSLFELFFEKDSYSVISSKTRDPYLQACFNYLWGDFGCPPKESPFFLTAAVNEHFISHGAFYPKNGPAMIPYCLIKNVLNNGGAFYTKTMVKQILLRQNTKNKLESYGVEVAIDNKKEGSTLQFTADVVISGTGLTQTFQKLILPEVTEKACPTMYSLLKTTKPSISYLNLFVGFSESSAKLNLPARNNWVISDTDFDRVGHEWFNCDDPFDALDKYSMPLLFIGFPSAKDSNYDYNNDNCSTCVAITLCPYRWFEMWNDLPLGKRGDQYEALKKAFIDKMFGKILELYPQLENKQEVCILGSPVTSNHYFNTENGEIYGLHHDIERFKFDSLVHSRPETGINNLYVTGQDIFSAGVSSAIAAGMLTASKVLDRNVFDDLKNLYSKKINNQLIN